MEDINKNSTISYEEENLNNNPDLSNENKDINLGIMTPKQVSVTVQNDLKANLFQISRTTRYYIYTLELLCLLNFDQGAISASSKEIKIFFKMTDRELGSFGGISFLGTTLGGIFSLSIINQINRKYIILSLIIVSICSLYFPTIISSKLFFIFCRILTGFSQSFMSIYLPVWIDQFGIYKRKSLMLSIISIPNAFGYLLGNVLAVFTSWRTTFRINAIMGFCLFIGFFLNKNIYFSKSIIPIKKANNIKKNIDEISMFEDVALASNVYQNQSLINNTIQCFKSKLFRYMTLAIISIFFILSGLQFWVNDFFENALYIIDKKQRLLSFAIIIIFTALVAPITGGLIMQKLGGYDSNRVIYLPFCCCILSLCFSNLMLFYGNKYYILILLELYLFSGTIIIPCLNGILISNMSKELAGSVSAISNLLYNICGRLIGPYFYGVARSIFDKHSRLPMIVLFDMKLVTALCLYKSFKYRKAPNKKNENYK